jgi:murein L,D-transpeptidase YafK
MRFFLVFILSMLAVAAPAYPKKLYELEKYLKGYGKTYFLYVDKKINKMYLVDKKYKVWRRYVVATGMNAGDKLFESDYKTPAGVYMVKEIYQYHEPWYMPKIREKIKLLPEGSKTRELYVKYYAKLESSYRRGKKRITALNGTFLRAEEGHVKYGTGEALGYNSYGPVFIRLDYPNNEDMERYEEAKDDGLIPRRGDNTYKGPGGGIAIHGTNDNGSLGFRASAGCVRMKNENIRELSDYVMEGTMVIID